jgi:hypothetical protein
LVASAQIAFARTIMDNQDWMLPTPMALTCNRRAVGYLRRVPAGWLTGLNFVAFATFVAFAGPAFLVG